MKSFIAIRCPKVPARRSINFEFRWRYSKCRVVITTVYCTSLISDFFTLQNFYEQLKILYRSRKFFYFLKSVVNVFHFSYDLDDGLRAMSLLSHKRQMSILLKSVWYPSIIINARIIDFQCWTLIQHRVYISYDQTPPNSVNLSRIFIWKQCSFYDFQSR